MHVDVTGHDNARREAKEKERREYSVECRECAIYTVEPLFATLNAVSWKKNFLRLATSFVFSDTKRKMLCDIEPRKFSSQGPKNRLQSRFFFYMMALSYTTGLLRVIKNFHQAQITVMFLRICVFLL